MKTRIYKILLFLIFLQSCLLSVSAQIINTYAGNGAPSFGGDGGQAVLAYLNNPYGICVDTLGNLYIADVSNDRIRKVDAGGVITTFAGSPAIGGGVGDGGPATAASLFSPKGVAADRHGNIFFTDAGNYRIRKIAAAGTITTIAGSGVFGNTGDGGPATAAQIGAGYGIAADNAGNVYFSVPGLSIVRKVDAAGIISRVAGTSIAGFNGDGIAATTAQLSSPNGLAVDAAGNLYIADGGNNRIRKVNTAGIITTIAGIGTAGFSGDGSAATSAQLSGPSGVCIDALGNTYIADQLNGRIRKINSLGMLTTAAGSINSGFFGDGGPATAAWLNNPSDVAVAPDGKIYLADYSNERIRVLDNVPAFSYGKVQTVTFCGFDVQEINTLLAITDGDPGQIETWSLLQPPVHGVAIAAYSAVSTGGTVLPSGLTYTPLTGYIGMDSFKVRVSDGAASDTTTINISILNLPDAGVITGVNKVCVGASVMLTETMAGGTWSCTNVHASVASGVVTGITTGVDTVEYTVTNTCGSSAAMFSVGVLSGGACDNGGSTHTGLPVWAHSSEPGIVVYPSPSHRTFVFNFLAATNEPTHVTIVNTVGVRISEFTATTNTALPFTLDAPAGIYQVIATNSYGIYTEKIALQ